MFIAAAAIIAPFVWDASDAPSFFPTSAVLADGPSSYKIGSAVTLFQTPRVSVEGGTIALASSQSYRARTVEALFALLSGGSAAMVLDGATFTVDPVASDGASADEALGPLLSAARQMKFGTIYLRNCRVIVKKSGSRQEVIEQLSGKLAMKRQGKMEARGDFVLRGEEISFQATLKPGGQTTATRLPLRASFKGALMDASIDGHLVLGEPSIQLVATRATVSMPHLRKAARWLASSWPRGDGFASARVEGPLEWSGETISFEKANIELDGNTARGGLSLSLTERPQIEGTLAFDTLDLGPYLPEQPAGAGNAKSLSGMLDAALAMALDRSTSLIREIDADIRISAGEIVLQGENVGRGAAAVSIRDGKLQADLAEFEFADKGTGAFQFECDMTGIEPGYGIRGRLDGIEVGNAASLLFGTSILTGIGTIEGDLASSGSSEEALRASLAGKVSVIMTEGATVSVDIAALTSQATSAPRTGWSPPAGGATTLNQFSAQLSASRGVFATGALIGQSDKLDVAAEGTIDVGNKAVDMSMTVATKTLLSRVGAGSPSTRIVQIRGPWLNPTIRSPLQPDRSAQPLSPSTPPAPEPAATGALPDRG